jgi:DNA-binding NarL/FixJ family response regulator
VTFGASRLTPAESEAALFLLKGFSQKKIGNLTGKSERTVHQHAIVVYRKSGLSGRAE